MLPLDNFSTYLTLFDPDEFMGRSPYLVVCNYGPGNPDNNRRPYTEGVSCEQCPDEYDLCYNTMPAEPVPQPEPLPGDLMLPGPSGPIGGPTGLPGSTGLCCELHYIVYYNIYAFRLLFLQITWKRCALVQTHTLPSDCLEGSCSATPSREHTTPPSTWSATDSYR